MKLPTVIDLLSWPQLLRKHSSGISFTLLVFKSEELHFRDLINLMRGEIEPTLDQIEPNKEKSEKNFLVREDGTFCDYLLSAIHYVTVC